MMDLRKKETGDIYEVIGGYAERTVNLQLDLMKGQDHAALAEMLCGLYTDVTAGMEKKGEMPKEAEMEAILADLAFDIFMEVRKDACFIGMENAVKTLVWRCGYLFVLCPNLQSESCTANMALLLASLIRFDQKNPVKPNRMLMQKMTESYAGLDEAGADELTEAILEQSGVRNLQAFLNPSDSTVFAYSHPVDSGIIRILDNPMVNGLFRKYVSTNADAYFGQMLASGIPVNAQNYPQIDQIVDECVSRLKIRRPYVVVVNIPEINAATFGSDEEPYMIISSLMLKVMNEDQMRFVIGHECGHIAMGHVMYHTAASLLSLLGMRSLIIGKAVIYALNAWARRSEITADRAALICCENLEIAQRALLKIEAAFMDVSEMDIEAYVRNSREYLAKGFFRKAGELKAEHPITAKRIEALDAFASSRPYYKAMHLPIPEDALSDGRLSDRVEAILKVL